MLSIKLDNSNPSIMLQYSGFVDLTFLQLGEPLIEAPHPKSCDQHVVCFMLLSAVGTIGMTLPGSSGKCLPVS